MMKLIRWWSERWSQWQHCASRVTSLMFLWRGRATGNSPWTRSQWARWWRWLSSKPSSRKLNNFDNDTLSHHPHHLDTRLFPRPPSAPGDVRQSQTLEPHLLRGLLKRSQHLSQLLLLLPPSSFHFSAIFFFPISTFIVTLQKDKGQHLQFSQYSCTLYIVHKPTTNTLYPIPIPNTHHQCPIPIPTTNTWNKSNPIADRWLRSTKLLEELRSLAENTSLTATRYQGGWRQSCADHNFQKTWQSLWKWRHLLWRWQSRLVQVVARWPDPGEEFLKPPAEHLKTPGEKFVKHGFHFLVTFWAHRALNFTPNILPRCDKTSETHSYIFQRTPLIPCPQPIGIIYIITSFLLPLFLTIHNIF